MFKWNKTETIYRIKQTIHPLWTLYTHNILIVHKQITGLSTHSDERQPKYTFKVEPIFFYIMKIHCWLIINNTDLKKHKRSNCMKRHIHHIKTDTFFFHFIIFLYKKFLCPNSQQIFQLLPFLTWFDQKPPFINGITVARNGNIGLYKQTWKQIDI